MIVLKFLHGVNKNLHALERKCIVERSTETTNTAVTLDANDAFACCKFEEVLLKLFVLGLHYEANIHERAAILVSSTNKLKIGNTGGVLNIEPLSI